jgi:hypothetical protein
VRYEDVFGTGDLSMELQERWRKIIVVTERLKKSMREGGVKKELLRVRAWNKKPCK